MNDTYISLEHNAFGEHLCTKYFLPIKLPVQSIIIFFASIVVCLVDCDYREFNLATLKHNFFGKNINEKFPKHTLRRFVRFLRIIIFP